MSENRIMNDKLKNELEIALCNVERARDVIKVQLDKVQGEDAVDMNQVHLLVNYKLELLDVKLRLKDFLEHLHLIKFD